MIKMESTALLPTCKFELKAPPPHLTSTPKVTPQEASDINQQIIQPNHIGYVDKKLDPCDTSKGNSYLTRLVNNPLFEDLQKALAADCNRNSVPYSLLQIGSDQREPRSPGYDSEISQSSTHVDLIVEEATLQAEFHQLAPLNNSKVAELECFYQSQASAISAQRAEALENVRRIGHPPEKEAMQIKLTNYFYTEQQAYLTVRVSKSLQLLKCVYALDFTNPSGHRAQKKSRLLNGKAVSIMHEWYMKNVDNPYPSDEEKIEMADKGGISVSQVKAWFANKRNRSLNTRPKRQRTQLQQQLSSMKEHVMNGGAPYGGCGGFGSFTNFLSDISHLVADNSANLCRLNNDLAENVNDDDSRLMDRSKDTLERLLDNSSKDQVEASPGPGLVELVPGTIIPMSIINASTFTEQPNTQ